MDNLHKYLTKENVCCFLSLVSLVLVVLILLKVHKKCKEKFKTTASPPSPSGPASWNQGNTQDCKQSFDMAGCDDTIECCGCGDGSPGSGDGGPLYYCDGQMMATYTTGSDASCPEGTPVALNKSMCDKPVSAGPMYCGGSVPNDCGDYNQKCKLQAGLPFGASGICGK